MSDSIVRCTTLSVASPVEGSWEALWRDLHACWAQTTAASNWLMTELAKADHQRLPGDAKLPPMPATYFYPKLTQLFPDLDTRTCASLERAVKRKYKAVLYQVLWQHAASLPTYRYPTPYPVHNQAWRPSWDQGTASQWQAHQGPVALIPRRATGPWWACHGDAVPRSAGSSDSRAARTSPARWHSSANSWKVPPSRVKPKSTDGVTPCWLAWWVAFHRPSCRSVPGL